MAPCPLLPWPSLIFPDPRIFFFFSLLIVLPCPWVTCLRFFLFFLLSDIFFFSPQLPGLTRMLVLPRSGDFTYFLYFSQTGDIYDFLILLSRFSERKRKKKGECLSVLQERSTHCSGSLTKKNPSVLSSAYKLPFRFPHLASFSISSLTFFLLLYSSLICLLHSHLLFVYSNSPSLHLPFFPRTYRASS